MNQPTEIHPKEPQLNRYEIATEPQLNRYEIATGKTVGRPKEWTEKRAMSLIDPLLAYVQEEPLPSLEEFCLNNGYYPSLIGKLCRDWPQFHAVVQNIKNFMAMKVSKGVMENRFNSRFAPMYLSHSFGWVAPTQVIKANNTNTDTVDVTHHGAVNVTYEVVPAKPKPVPVEGIPLRGPLHHEREPRGGE
jgi:hypothetical protein